jgi:uncharacterized protein (UPF0332 family)
MNSKEVNELIDKAKQSLDAARHLYDDGFYDFSASRAYYAMFYCAEALFISKNRSFSKHSSLISAFGRDFIKSGAIDEKYHRYLIEAFELRNAGDYGIINSVNKEKSNVIIQKAEEFIQYIYKFIFS